MPTSGETQRGFVSGESLECIRCGFVFGPVKLYEESERLPGKERGPRPAKTNVQFGVITKIGIGVTGSKTLFRAMNICTPSMSNMHNTVTGVCDNMEKILESSLDYNKRKVRQALKLRGREVVEGEPLAIDGVADGANNNPSYRGVSQRATQASLPLYETRGNPTDDVFDEPTFTYEEFSQYDGLWLRHLLLHMTSPLQQAKTTPEDAIVDIMQDGRSIAIGRVAYLFAFDVEKQCHFDMATAVLQEKKEQDVPLPFKIHGGKANWRSMKTIALMNTMVIPSPYHTAWTFLSEFAESQRLNQVLKSQEPWLLLFVNVNILKRIGRVRMDMASAGMEHRVVQCCCLATLSEENKVSGDESLPPDLSFHVLEECHGPDGAEGFQILANDKVEVMVRLWERHLDSDKKRLSYFSCHQKKLAKGRWGRILAQSGQTAADMSGLCIYGCVQISSQPTRPLVRHMEETCLDTAVPDGLEEIEVDPDEGSRTWM
ncbi:Hypp6631 [Branchiostoma lanceolatum]|uniref:Hypp6631 protein n=1 Tax=Branchiostoma lanceolatum TaxID=7740 RepID=A0A8J9YVF2_BRALA|nr:Hypp6631 [Branchiostoma lanceolatum]